MKKKKKHERKSVNNQLQASDIEEFNDDMPEEEFKLIIKEPEPQRRKKRKRKNFGTRTRCYDMRLVWLFLLLAGLVLLVRAVICRHFGIPFLNEIDPNSPDGKEFIGHDLLSESCRQLEQFVMLIEAFISLIATGIFVQSPKNKNSRNDGSEMDSIPIWLWGIGIMALPYIILCCTSYWWVAYGIAMLLFAFLIGRYEGFALPLFKNVGRNFWYGTKDMTVKYRPFRHVYFSGHSAVWVGIIVLAIFLILTIYSFYKAW